MDNSVKRIYTKNVVKISAEASIATANEMMNNYNIRHLPVVDNENYLVGILSRSDFNGIKFVDSRFSGFKVKDVMSSPVKIVTSSAKISDVANTMITSKISCLLVAKEDELVGILTTDDLLKILVGLDTVQESMAELDIDSLADEGWISATRSHSNMCSQSY